MSEKLKSSIIYGITCSLVGIAVGLHVAFTAVSAGYESFPATAGLASFLSAFTLWYLLFESRENPIPFAITGILTVLLAHYLTFYIELVRANICFHAFNSCKSSLGEAPMNLLQAIWGSAVFSFMSLFIYGWVTIPAGILIAFIFKKVRKRREI